VSRFGTNEKIVQEFNAAEKSDNGDPRLIFAALIPQPTPGTRNGGLGRGRTRPSKSR